MKELFVLTICALFVVNGTHKVGNGNDQSFGNEAESFGNGTRSKRNTGNTNSPESLLASCQVTNLLLYQALAQQRQVNAANSNPLLALASNLNLQGLGSNLPLPLGQSQLGFGQANFLAPNLIFPSLTTYTTTSTWVTKMTTENVVTVPLLFGNRQSLTTITRTKIVDLTTSEVKTLTGTVTPTVATPVIAPTTTVLTSAEIVPTPTAAFSVPAAYDDVSKGEYDVYEEPVQYQVNDVQEEKERRSSVPSKKTYEPVETSKPVQKSRGSVTFAEKKRKKSPPKIEEVEDQRKFILKPKKATTPAPEYDYYSYAQPPKSKKKSVSNSYVQPETFYDRQYGSTQAQNEEYPEDDYGSYARRLKRGEQVEEEYEEVPREREYLLEPSYDGDHSGSFGRVEQCPPAGTVTLTLTSTEIRTITKFLKGQTQASTTVRNFVPAATSKSFSPSSTRRGTYNKRRENNNFESNPSTNYENHAISTSERSERSPQHTTGDPRAQILRRGRTRYNPENEYRG